MQTSGKKVYFQLSECSLSYAKIRINLQKAKLSYAINYCASPTRTEWDETTAHITPKRRRALLMPSSSTLVVT